MPVPIRNAFADKSTGENSYLLGKNGAGIDRSPGLTSLLNCGAEAKSWKILAKARYGSAASIKLNVASRRPSSMIPGPTMTALARHCAKKRTIARIAEKSDVARAGFVDRR